MRSQEDKDIIKSNIADPYSIINFLSTDEIQELINLYHSTQDKVHKNTGPVTVDINKDMLSLPIFQNILEKSKFYLGDDFNVYTAMFFYVERAHIIHNDDAFNFPLIYKGINLPLELTYFTEHREYPSLCFFDQYYLEGPSKFFKGNKEIPTYYNKCVYEYSEVQNKSTQPFHPKVYEKYMSHLQPQWLEELSFQSAQPWIPGNAIIFDCARLHCASNFVKQGVKSKLGISIFTSLD